MIIETFWYVEESVTLRKVVREFTGKPTLSNVYDRRNIVGKVHTSIS